MWSHHQLPGAGLAGLVRREHPVPRPGPRQVLVRVRAVSLNARDLLILMHGRYPLPLAPDAVAACDGAGEVVEVGQGVRAVAVGDRVVASIFPDWQDGPFRPEVAAQLGGSLDGLLTEYAVLPEGALLTVPEHLSDVEAATLPCAGVTAWNALTGGRGLTSGQTVLTLGAGGVSLFALQLARAAGARVIATTSSPARAARLRELGADEVIDYRATPDWEVEVRRLTRGRGVDHVVEVGGPATLARSFRALAQGGEVAWVGWLGGGPSTVDLTAFAGTAGTLRRAAVGSRAQFAALNRALVANRLRPVIGRVFPFDAAPQAYAHYAGGGEFGKVVITVP